MDVEIDDRDTLRAMNGLRLPRRYGGEIEEAKPHRPRGLGMMARRAHRHEGVIHLAAHDFVHGDYRTADGMRNRLPCPRAHHDVFGDLDEPRRGRRRP